MEGHFLTALFILLTFASYINSSSAARVGVAAGKTSIEFIRTSCSSTTYPTLCFSSLSTHASVIQTSAQLLAHTALSVTLDNTRSTSATMLKLSQIHGLKPAEVAAVRDCVEQVSESVDQLRKSLGEMNHMKGSNFGLTMNDVQTWVSAALTNDDTCTEGFSSNAMNGNVKIIVRRQIVNITHLTSNALALINSFASLHG